MEIIGVKSRHDENPRGNILQRIEVEQALKRLGIFPDCSGYRLLVMATQIWLDYLGEQHEGLPPQVTKTVYPRIARIVGRSPWAVERNMRHAVNRAMDNEEQRAYICRSFGCHPRSGREAFSVSEFVALLAQQIYTFGGVGPVRGPDPAA